jgi:hypothetical protein
MSSGYLYADELLRCCQEKQIAGAEVQAVVDVLIVDIEVINYRTHWRNAVCLTDLWIGMSV